MWWTFQRRFFHLEWMNNDENSHKFRSIFVLIDMSSKGMEVVPWFTCLRKLYFCEKGDEFSRTSKANS